MSHAEKVKSLVQELLVESNHNGHPLNVEQAEESLQEFHAAIDEMQEEIDRAQQSEKEGWRYSNELEQERRAQKAEIDRLNKSLLFLATNEARLHRVREKGFRVMVLDKNCQWQPACGADAMFDSAEDAIEAAMKSLGEVA